jgi:hypothetical protein
VLAATISAAVAAAACGTDRPAAARGAYATSHDTMPDSIHQAMHRARDRTDGDRAHGKGVRVGDSKLMRIAGTKDAWLDFALEREPGVPHDDIADTVSLIMNCNADSLVTLMANGRPLGQTILVPPGARVRFSARDAMRVRIYGLRPLKPGSPTETLVRLTLGGDLVLLTDADAP